MAAITSTKHSEQHRTTEEPESPTRRADGAKYYRISWPAGCPSLIGVGWCAFTLMGISVYSPLWFLIFRFCAEHRVHTPSPTDSCNSGYQWKSNMSTICSETINEKKGKVETECTRIWGCLCFPSLDYHMYRKNWQRRGLHTWPALDSQHKFAHHRILELKKQLQFKHAETIVQSGPWRRKSPEAPWYWKKGDINRQRHVEAWPC